MSASVSGACEILVNGRATVCPAGQSLTEFLQWLQIDLERVAIELDREIIRKRDWATTPIVSGAQIEIVEFVGGG